MNRFGGCGGMVKAIALAMTWVLLVAAAPPNGPRDPQRFSFIPPKQALPGEELVIRGDNDGPAEITLVTRIDDGKSGDYGSRANIERVLPPGPFTLRILLGGLSTSAGGRLDDQDLRRIIVFTGKGLPARFDSVRFEIAPVLPAPAVGWDLGTRTSAVYPGFLAVAPRDERLAGRSLSAVERPGGDALVADGVRGIERFAAELPNGRWRITLWTDEMGQWENVPHPLRRRIRANGVTVLDETLSPAEWIGRKYLAGWAQESLPGTSAWDAFGRFQGRPLTVAVDVVDGRLNLELAGDSPQATFLAAVLAEPGDQDAVFQAVQAARAVRFDETWRIAPIALPPAKGLQLWALPSGSPFSASVAPGGAPAPVVAPGGLAIIDVGVLSEQADDRPEVVLEPLRLDEAVLPADLRFGQWRLERPNSGATLLEWHADHLRGDLAVMTLAAGVPRRLNLTLHIPPRTPPGRYVGSLTVRSGGMVGQIPLAVEVVDVDLPDADRPIGLYLERAPHLDWFNGLAAARRSQGLCDIETLRRFGLTSLAPPLATPDSDRGRAMFHADLSDVRDAGFDQPLLSYTTVKRLAHRRSPTETAQLLAPLALQLDATAPIWAIADEPSNVGPGQPDPRQLATALRNIVPGVRLAGQLNSPKDRRLADIFDVALINRGFGLDDEAFASLRTTGVEPWLYNLGDQRLAAGFYLWRSGAGGYLQWHGRMPTADPFDPTDGREADVQFLLPQPDICPMVTDIHAALSRLAEGILDLRWLRWLEAQASNGDAQAKHLVETLRAEVPDRWEDALALGPQAPIRWREAITALARTLRAFDGRPVRG